jgi:hypothetical protein
MSRTPIVVAYNTKEVRTKNPVHVYPAKSVFIPPLPSDKKLRETWNNKNIAYYDVNDFFKDFKNFKEAKHLWLSVDGGIGDIIAMSAIFEYLKDYDITVYCNPSYWPIFDWFKHPPKLKAYNDVICANYGIDTKLTKYKDYARINLDYAAVDGGRMNWFDAMFERIGVSEGYDKRPQLKTERIEQLYHSYIYVFVPSILICHKSSCQMRSSKFEDFYIPIIKKYPNHRIYVHEIDLTDEDKIFTDYLSINDPIRGHLTIIPKCSLSEYFLNIYDADLVVGTDSAAIHFRESVEKPAIGVYGAFTTQSRTSGYKYVKSFNTVSDCPYQPCFIHETKQGEVCQFAKEGDKYAACQSGVNFQNQLFNNL